MPYTDLLKTVSTHHNAISFIDNEQETQLTYPDLSDISVDIGKQILRTISNRYAEIVLLTGNTYDYIKGFWSTLASESTVVIVPEADTCDGKKLPHMLRSVISQLLHPIILASEQICREEVEQFLGEKLVEIKLSHGLKLLLTQRAQSGALPSTNMIGSVIQYSSGSTGTPKGVCIPFEALIKSSEAVKDKLRITDEDRCLSWLPIAHNFALFGFHLTATLCDVPQVIMSPSSFLNDPIRWMEEMSARGTTITGAPNFAYQLILTVLHLDKSARDIDLKDLRIIVNGAEPVSCTLVERFETALEQYGMRRHIVVPAYGMAEATVGLTIDSSMSGISKRYCSRYDLNSGERIKLFGEDGDDRVTLTSVGTPCKGVEIRISNEGVPVEDGMVGEIEFRSSMMMSGYYDSGVGESVGCDFDREAWFPTGDLGVIVEGELYITGRLKDIIVINGKNYYPSDLETVLFEIEPSLHQHLAITAMEDTATASESIGVFIEGIPEQLQDVLSKQLRKDFTKKTGLRLSKITYIKQLPRTYNGKIRRNMLADMRKGASND